MIFFCLICFLIFRIKLNLINKLILESEHLILALYYSIEYSENPYSKVKNKKCLLTY